MTALLRNPTHLLRATEIILARRAGGCQGKTDVGNNNIIVVYSNKNKMGDCVIMKKLLRKRDRWAKTTALIILIALAIYGCSSGSGELTEPDPTIELTPQEAIERAVSDIVADLQATTLQDVKINKHVGTDDPDDFIVLVYLSFDAKNRANTAKRMIDMYNNEIGARLADIAEITEVTTFWEVPYLLEGQNVVKANMERQSSGMVYTDRWYDGRIF